MVYGYVRVSTKGQAKEGHSLEEQRKQIVERYGNAIIESEQYTATTMDRPVFNKLMEQLKEGDTLVVTRLDRMARNVVEGIQIVKELFERGVYVHVLNVGLLENTTMGEFFLTTLLAVAAMERNTIIERTQAGKAIARTKQDFREGRPRKFTQTQVDMALCLLDKHSYKQVAEMTRISVSTLVRAARKKKLQGAKV